MIKVEDILSPDRTADYQKGWKSFSKRYIPESEYHTHSGKPVICKVFRFEGEPIFRSHVVGERLKEIDPYFLFRKYPHKNWHIAHHILVSEQMYHASMRIIRDTNMSQTIESPKEIDLSEQILLSDNISTEFIWKPRRQTPKYSIEDCYFTFYDDKRDKVKGRIHVATFVKRREHVESIERLQNGDKETLEVLVRQIYGQARKHGRLLRPRTNLPTAEDLIAQLRSGYIPKEKLYDYFSLWDEETQP